MAHRKSAQRRSAGLQLAIILSPGMTGEHWPYGAPTLCAGATWALASSLGNGRLSGDNEGMFIETIMISLLLSPAADRFLLVGTELFLEPVPSVR